MARKRRGHGEGGVYQRASDGRWVGSITTGRTSGGRQKRRVVYGVSKVKVLTRLREIQKQHDAGTLTDPSTLTVEGYLRRWMETMGKTKRDTTQERRRIYVEQHINPSLGGIRLNKLALIHLESWLTDLEDAGRSTWTITPGCDHLGYRAQARREDETDPLQSGRRSRQAAAKTEGSRSLHRGAGEAIAGEQR
jgi:hypothetical protein